MDMTIKATNEINTFVTEYNDELQKLQGIYKVQLVSKLLPVFQGHPVPLSVHTSHPLQSLPPSICVLSLRLICSEIQG